MHVILVTVGTDGDVFPYVGLGAEMRSRGHRITLAASGHYEPLATRNGFAFRPLVTAEENRELFEHADFWNPLKNAPLMARWGAGFFERQFELLSNTVDNDSVLVASPGVLPAAVASEKLGTPLVSLVLQPWMIPSSIAPPIVPGLAWLRRAPRLVWKIVWRALDLVVYSLVGGKLNRLRARLGLKPVRRIVRNWLSTQLVIGFFPEWFGRPQPDWPPRMRLTGFPIFDGVSGAELPVELAEFCRSGPPPIAFTFGTGMAHSAALFRDALEVCARLGARGVFITKYADQLPALPRSVVHAPFAPFQKLFPQCAAVVHHGGVGTVAAAMAAGVPQLIRPLCFDQLDNGARVTALGAGDCGRRNWTPTQTAGALRALLTPETSRRCREIAGRFTPNESFVSAAQHIEALHAMRG